MEGVNGVDLEMAEKIARITRKGLFREDKEYIPHVDDIHEMVENKLMDNGLNDVAREYIIYRSKHKPNIFAKRVNLKPYEYPELVEYVDAIRHSYWVHTEFNFTSDIQDFKVHLTEEERTTVQRAMLAISQIEIAVKTFWGDIYKKLPKPEIGNVGAICFKAGDKTHIAIRDDADELSVTFHDGKPRDAETTTQVIDFGNRGVRGNRDRIRHHARFISLDLVDRLHLVLNRHVSVQDTDAALAGHGNRHPRFGHRVHGCGKHGGVHRDALREPGGSIRL